MIWHESDNPVYGRTNNPWNLDRTCGGSSGGEAAIIAARGSPLGMGNDLGGSIRIPSHFCGIHGIRPTSLRLPRGGTMRTLRGFEAFLTQSGPMARHVEDLWLGLQVLTDNSADGYVAGDVTPASIGNPANVEIDKLKIAAWTDDGVFPPSPAVARAVQRSCRGTAGARRRSHRARRRGSRTAIFGRARRSICIAVWLAPMAARTHAALLAAARSTRASPG